MTRIIPRLHLCIVLQIGDLMLSVTERSLSVATAEASALAHGSKLVLCELKIIPRRGAAEEEDARVCLVIQMVLA